MAESSEDRVELTELDVITRYSLAVRAATADRQELIAALRADLQWLEGDRRGSAAATPRTPRPAAAKAPVKAPAKSAAKSTARKTTTSSSSTRRAR